MSSEFNNPEKENAVTAITKNTEEIAQVNNLNELYALTDEILQNVKTVYPEMLCKAGCNQCCKTYGSPLVTPLEWEKIKDFLDKAPNDFKDKIRSALHEVKNRLKQRKTADLNQVINNIQCPFLQDEICSVYPIRPLVCRMFGSFISRPDLPGVTSNSIYTCEMEKDRWDKEITEKALTKITLPNKSIFHNKVEDLNDEKGKALFLINYIDSYFKLTP
jgi:Fe-S-cluster containining protein